MELKGVAEKQSVLFVCLGNICRSPLAEAAFREEMQRAGLDVDVESAGTSDWHVGAPPDRRAQAVARKHGIEIGGYRGQQVCASDFRRFAHIVALDANNLAALEALRPKDAMAELSLLLDHVDGRSGQSVADPYYGEAAAFEQTWTEVVSGAKGLASKFAAHP